MNNQNDLIYRMNNPLYSHEPNNIHNRSRLNPMYSHLPNNIHNKPINNSLQNTSESVSLEDFIKETKESLTKLIWSIIVKFL
jgi:hypothetical protein